MKLLCAPSSSKTETLTSPQLPGVVGQDLFPRRFDSVTFEKLSSPRIHLGTTAISHAATETVSLRDTGAARKPVVINGDTSIPLSLGDRLTRIKDTAHQLLERADLVPPASPTTFSSNIVAITRPAERIIAQPQDDRSAVDRIADFAVRQADSFKASIKYLHPADFVRRFKADFAALRDLNKSGGYEEIKSDPVSLARKIHGRLVASLVFSDAAAYLSMPVGIAVQAKTGDPYLTLAAGVLSGYAIAVVAFQGAFGCVSQDLYKKNNPLDRDATKKDNVLTRAWAAVKNFESDLFPIHVKAFKAALVCYAISLPLCSGIIETIKLLPTAVQHYMPISVIEMGLSITVFEGIFLKMLSRFNEAHAKNLASKYAQPASSNVA